MQLKKIKIFVTFICFLSLFSSCGELVNNKSIGNNTSFPVSIVNLDSSNILILNSNATMDYIDGSIQAYSIDSSNNKTLQNTLSVLPHGSELAVSSGSTKLVALAFDNSVPNTQILFYDYSNLSAPVPLPNLTLSLFNAGEKQSVKQLGFFKRASDDNFYLYGTIYSAQPVVSTTLNIPTRVFVAKISSDLKTSKVLFTLSYGLNEPVSLSAKSNSIANYNLGSTAPVYDSAHDLFISFPVGRFAQSNTLLNPTYPKPFDYFAGVETANPDNQCDEKANCTNAPDMRAFSMMVVNMNSLISNYKDNDDAFNKILLNKNTYFVPLAWNENGLPYGSKTKNGVIINSASYIADKDQTNDDLFTFQFQSVFWSSYWMNNSDGSCPVSSIPANDSNKYNYNIMGQNALLVSKAGSNYGSSSSENEIMQIGGLNFLFPSINLIKNNVDNLSTAPDYSDFKNVEKYQILDAYNAYYNSIATSWLNKNESPDKVTFGVSPIIPYMYSRTVGVQSLNVAAQTIPVNFGVVKVNNKCIPYWVRSTNGGYSNLGAESSWITANITPVGEIKATDIYQEAVTDPTLPSVFSFPSTKGVQYCVNLNSPTLVCVNFLDGLLSTFKMSDSGDVFTQN